MRDSAICMLYQSVKDRLGVDLDGLRAFLANWEVLPLVRDGAVVGAFAIKDGEVHLGYGVLPKGSIRKDLREVLAPALTRYGALRTSVSEVNRRGLEFCKRLGFQEVERKNGIVYMRCERLNYV